MQLKQENCSTYLRRERNQVKNFQNRRAQLQLLGDINLRIVQLLIRTHDHRSLTSGGLLEQGRLEPLAQVGVQLLAQLLVESVREEARERRQVVHDGES